MRFQKQKENQEIIIIRKKIVNKFLSKMETEIKRLTSQDIDDFIELIKVFEEVFEIKNFAMPAKEYLQRTLSNENFLASVAKRDGKIIAGFTAYHLDSYYSEKPLAYIYDLAVLSAFQRQGIGKKLIAYFIQYCKEKSFKEVFVQAEEGDDHAIEFYRATKPTREAKAIHFTYVLEK